MHNMHNFSPRSASFLWTRFVAPHQRIYELQTHTGSTSSRQCSQTFAITLSQAIVPLRRLQQQLLKYHLTQPSLNACIGLRLGLLLCGCVRVSGKRTHLLLALVAPLMHSRIYSCVSMHPRFQPIQILVDMPTRTLMQG